MHCDHQECRQVVWELVLLSAKHAKSVKEIEDSIHTNVMSMLAMDLASGRDAIESASNAIRVAMDSREMLSEYLEFKMKENKENYLANVQRGG